MDRPAAGRASSKAAGEPDRTSLQKMSAAEAILICFSLLSLVVSCVLWSSRKQEWVDEIYTWTEVNDHSLWHLYYAIQHGADGGMPLFYTTAWTWARIFGSSALALRLYSCMAFCAALVVVWHVLRRAYGVRSTAFGILAVFGTSTIILDQNAEARYYGLYTLTVALAIAFYARLAEEENPKLLLMAGGMLAQAALAFSHVLGIVYGALILFSLVLFDATKGRLRIKLYLFQAAGWLVLFLWLPAILSSMAAGKPHGWIHIPVNRDVLTSYNFEMWLNPILLLQLHASLTHRRYESLFVHAIRHSLLLVVAAAMLTAGMKSFRNLRSDAGRRESRKAALTLVALSILATPLILLVLSHLVTPVYVPRYALPSALGMAIALTAFADALGLDRLPKLQPIGSVIWGIVLVVLVSMPVVSALTLFPGRVNPEYLDVPQLDAIVPPNVPVVVGWQHDFFKVMRYSGRKDRPYVFLLDWPTALQGQDEFVPDFHLMSSYRRVGYYSDSIRDQTEFICTHPYFLVLDHSVMSWLEAATKELPDLRPQAVATVDDQRQLFAVHSAGTDPACQGR